MKHFSVTAKCGHVGGIDKYILIEFYIAADSAKEAAAKIRMFGRVQHDKKDAIQSVKQISEEDYLCGLNSFREDPYNLCNNPQEQKEHWEAIAPRVQTEVHYDYRHKYRAPNHKRAQRYGYKSCGRMGKSLYEDDDYCA